MNVTVGKSSFRAQYKGNSNRRTLQNYDDDAGSVRTSERWRITLLVIVYLSPSSPASLPRIVIGQGESSGNLGKRDAQTMRSDHIILGGNASSRGFWATKHIELSFG